MTEYSRMAKGKFVSTGNAKAVVLPFVPNLVKMTNYTVARAGVANHKVFSASWDANMGQGFAVEEVYNATALVADVVEVNGISTFEAGLSFQFGPIYQHTGSTDFSISKANPAVVTTTTAHGLQTGDVIVFSNLAQTSTTGMQQIAGLPFMVTVTAPTTFTINWNTNQSNYTAFNSATSTGNVGSFKKILYPNLYLPPDSFISALTLSTGPTLTTSVSTTAQHNMVIGQEVAFRIPSVWGTIELNSLPNNVIPGSPIYGYVQSITDAQNFVVAINSTGYTSFNSNQLFSAVGITPAQVVPVGDINSGGAVYAGGALYPSPTFSFATVDDSSTINGPAIRGAFINNTRQGFIIGAGPGIVDTASVLVGTASDVIYWEAYLVDYSNP